MRITIIIGTILNLGIFIRLLSLIKLNNSYLPLIIGQIFSAIVAPFFLNSTALFVARWFSPSQCDIATSICSMANPLGLAIGSHLPSLIITDNRSLKYFFILLIKHHQSINLKQDFINLIKNRHYLILLFCFTLGLALFNTITTLIEQLIKPSIYTSEDAGIFGAIIIIIAGLLNAFLAGFIMDKTDAYRLILKFLLIGACASAIFFILIIRPNQFNRLSLSN
ncbi:unnamed protein product [Rotaria sp. Silwood1]|nr:unnamed protein product [Rotaria sp. Silwood1]CAF3609001.1 unnamed protein product [Rotaria sp. Silwood1]CAF5028558.1 unnamed protein product [Rotaria sp. Silwood1]